jgi:hypothetical protein
VTPAALPDTAGMKGMPWRRSEKHAHDQKAKAESLTKTCYEEFHWLQIHFSRCLLKHIRTVPAAIRPGSLFGLH